MAAARVGEFPETVSARRGPAMRHAVRAWTEARTGMVNRAGSLWTLVDRDPKAFGGQVDLAFLATLGAHIRRCAECDTEWIDGEVPLDLLTRAVRRIPAWEVFRPVLREVRAARGRPVRRRGS
jgi:hypothetical protein